MAIRAIFQKILEMPWVPASVLFGEKLLVEGEDVIFLKILSDRRSEGGGVAELSKFSPPSGKRIRIKAVAESDEHVYILEGGHEDGTGKQIRSRATTFSIPKDFLTVQLFLGKRLPW